MCYAFLTYYPINDNFSGCSQWQSVDVCSNVPLNCSVTLFAQLAQTAGSVCTSVTCSPACQALMTKLVNTGCLTGEIGQFITQFGNNPQGMTWLIQMANLCSETSTVSSSAGMIAAASATQAATILPLVLLAFRN